MPIFRVLCAAAWALSAGFAQARADCTSLIATLSATVAHVIAADTLRLDDGSELRLAGILVPRAEEARAVAEAWPGAVAAKAEVAALVLGKSIGLSFGSERRDRYGRHIAHVRLEGSDATWLQGHLLAQGLARAAPRANDRTCEAEMLGLEQQARAASLGLWREAAYRVLRADDLDTLTARTGTFVIIEGRVTESRRSGGNLRLEFAQAKRFGLAALITPPKNRRDATNYKDTRVRIRGWIEERSGRPMLDLTTMGALELIEEPSPRN